ncbi:MAG: Fe(3+)-hydroxamate ABC transporter permease FhuB [Pseudomonadota bacterium]
MKRIAAGLGALLALAAMHLAVQPAPGADRIVAILTGSAPEGFVEVVFLNASLPRTAMAALVGASLGLAGSLLQQLLRNPLASPTTLGVASGAWLGMTAGTVFAPTLTATHGGLFAFSGALLAGLLVVVIAGPRGMAGLGAVLAGLAVSLLFGALARALVLIEDQRLRDLGIWVAGDLSQSGWGEVHVLLAQVLAVLGLAIVCARPLTLLRLGFEIAAGRGLALAIFAPLVALGALALTASAIAAVGPIAFVGLLAPAITRAVGAVSSRAEVLGATLVGAAALLATDALAISASTWAMQLVPSGAVAPLLGAPALIILLLRRRSVERPWVLAVLPAQRRAPRPVLATLAALLLAAMGITLVVGRAETGWQLADLDDLALAFRWPRVLAAAAGGVALGIAGTILQRLLRNPLASPDVIGVSAGAGLAVVIAVLVLGVGLSAAALPAAAVGAGLVLAALLLADRLGRGDPQMLALTGLALAALLDSLLSVAFAAGGDGVYSLLGWLSSSTHRVEGWTAMRLTLWVLPLMVVAVLLARWIDLLSLGVREAGAVGVRVRLARPVLLALAGTATALVTATIGLAPFVGLVAPHLARLILVGSALTELLASALIGGLMMVVADWIGRVALFPVQLPAGLIAALLGGAYLVALIARGRRSGAA